MRFSEIVNEAEALLESNERMSLRALKREFDLDDEALADLCEELVTVRGVASLKAPGVLSAVTSAGNDGDLTATQPAEQRDAERRQITVMFCDLVDSTSLSKAVDAEELLSVMRDYQATASAAIERFEGYIAQYLGDGLVAYFGWPAAHEDDASRAILAALEVIGAIGDVTSPGAGPLRVRVGIATGPVVVGDTTDGDASRPGTAVGETPNLAARMQQFAKPGEIVISDLTHRLSKDRFEFDDLGGHSLKGFNGEQQVWRVCGTAGPVDLRPRHVDQTQRRFVGRNADIALLNERWEQACDGEGNVVVLSAEAGLGKSRIIEEFRRSLPENEFSWLTYQCSPYHIRASLYPVIDEIERSAGFSRNDDQQTRLDKLERSLADNMSASDEELGLIANLLGIGGDAYPVPDINPDQIKNQTFTALTRHFQHRASQRPLLVAFEDAHWIDPTTEEWLGLQIELLPGLRCLMVLSCRQEYDIPWRAFNNVSVHALSRMSRRQGNEIIREVVGADALPDELCAQIIARADGIPLFIEELTEAILESRLTDGGAGSGMADELETIPKTLQDSLMARLDRLGAGKEIAQAGACIGRQFSFDLLCEASTVGRDAVEAGLTELVAANLLHQRGALLDGEFTFRHALIQDAAYQSLLLSHRREIHGRIARALQAGSGAAVSNEPELLAGHFEQAGEAPAALANWKLAGERAMRRSANVEAAQHYQHAISLLDDAVTPAERNDEELELQARLGPALIATKGYGAPETAACYQRAQALLASVDTTPDLFPILYGGWVTELTWANFDRALELADEFLRRAQREGTPEAVLTGFRLVGFSLSCTGDFAAARDSFERVRELYRRDEHVSLALRYGQDPWAAGTAMLGWNLWHLGYPDTARQLCDEAVAFARDIGHANTRGYAETFGATRVALFRGDVAEVRGYVESVQALCDEENLAFWPGFIRVFEGWCLMREERLDDALSSVEDGIRSHDETGTAMFRPHALAIRAEVKLHLGRLEEALTDIEQAEAQAQKTWEKWLEPELYRLHGEILFASSADGGASGAVLWLEKALETAQARGALGWALKAGLSLARYHQITGDGSRGKALLNPVVQQFSEGQETEDLRAALTVVSGT